MSQPASIHSCINRGKKYPEKSWLEVANDDPDYLRRHIINKPHISQGDQQLARDALRHVGEPLKAADRDGATTATTAAAAPNTELAIIQRKERQLIVREHVFRLMVLHAVAGALALAGWAAYLGLLGGILVDKALVMLVTGTALALLWLVESDTYRRYRVLMRTSDVFELSDHAFLHRFPVHTAFFCASVGSLLAARPGLPEPVTQLALPIALLSVQAFLVIAPWRLFGPDRPEDESSRLAQWVALLAWNMIRVDRFLRGRDERATPTRRETFAVARRVVAELGIAPAVPRVDPTGLGAAAETGAADEATGASDGHDGDDGDGEGQGQGDRPRGRSQAFLPLPGLFTRN